MDKDELERRSDAVRAKANYRRRVAEAQRAAAGVRVIPLQNPQRGPKLGAFAEDMTPEERVPPTDPLE